MKPICIIIFIAICIIGCKEKKEKQETDFSIQRLELANIIKNDTVSDYDLIDKFKYIKLETNDNCLIGEIRNLKLFDKRIIIADKNERVFVFDTLGKFISQVGLKGNGGQEYVALNGMFINEEEREIVLLDLKKMLHYDLNGKFIKSQRINSELSDMPLDIDLFKGSILKQTMCYSSSIYNSIICSEEDLSKLTNFHPYRMNRIVGSSRDQSGNTISKMEEGLSFVKYLSDTIFQFNGDSIYPKYILVTGKPPIPQKNFDSFNIRNELVSINNFLTPLKGKYSFGVNSIYETKDHIVIYSQGVSGSTDPFVWNKHEKKGIYIKWWGGKRTSLFLSRTIQDISNNQIVCTYDYTGRNRFKGGLKSIIEPTFKKLLDECDYNDNPIIALYTLKKEFPWESYKK